MPVRNTDQFGWSVPGSGSWTAAANWTDASTGLSGVPAAGNPVVFGISEPLITPLTVTGFGASASLATLLDLTLDGRFTTGDVALDTASTGPSQISVGSLSVSGPGATLAARSVGGLGDFSVSDGAAVTVSHGVEIDSQQITPNPGSFQVFSLAVSGGGSLVIGGTLLSDDGSFISANGGSYLEARAITLNYIDSPAGGYGVDDTSAIEVGTQHLAQAGTWTIDTHAALRVEGGGYIYPTLSAPLFVDNGEIFASGPVTFATPDAGAVSDITGTGQLDIEGGADVVLAKAGAPLTVYFAGGSGNLELTDGASAFASTIRGMRAGDSITVDGATFTSAYWLNGVLTLVDGAQTVGTVNVAGYYGGATFSASGDTVILSAAGNADPFTWTGAASGGRWDDGGNWQDGATGTTGGVPGAQNAVSFSNTSGNELVTGVGRSASITIQGTVNFEGTFATGALSSFSSLDQFGDPLLSAVEVSGAGNSVRAETAELGGALQVQAGASTVVAHDLEIFASELTQLGIAGSVGVDGSGTKLTVQGQLSTDDTTYLSVTNGAALQVGSMAISSNSLATDTLSVDARSSVEIGSGGAAAPGVWLIDPNGRLSLSGVTEIQAPSIVDNGVITATVQATLSAPITGTGEIDLSGNSCLVALDQVSGSITARFTNGGGTLLLLGGDADFQGIITGFQAGDAILDGSNTTFTRADWAGNVLTLLDGNTVVGQLNLVGNYAGDTFNVSDGAITLGVASAHHDTVVNHHAT